MDPRGPMEIRVDDIGRRAVAFPLPASADEILREAGLLRSRFRLEVLPKHQRELGQYLTPESIAALAAATTIDERTVDAIDPACGDGSMLWAACDDPAGRDLQRVAGIEIDPLLAKVAALPSGHWRPRAGPGVAVVSGDAFLTVAGLGKARMGYRAAFDAVLGNPPYVRYQSVAPLLDRLNPDVTGAFRSRHPHLGPARLVDIIIRTSLLAHLLPAHERTREMLALRSGLLLRSRPAEITDDLSERCWIQLIRGYSGLSDISVPMWFLTWLLARPGARVAYVTTGSSSRRNYGRVLRYFMHRFLQPILSVEQEGNRWFGEAQVTTSLLVFRARAFSEVEVPLADRTAHSQHVRVRVGRNWNLADPAILHRIAEDLEGPQDSLPAAARVVTRHMLAETRHAAWTVESTEERATASDLLAEESAARRVGTASRALLEMEGVRTGMLSVVHQEPSQSMPLPAALQDLVGDQLRFLSLASLGVTVNQGLRTGCNEFFYVRQVSGEASATGHDDVDERHVSVRTSELLGSQVIELPLKYFRRAVRYQRSLTRWQTRTVDLDDLVLVTQASARPRDLPSRLREVNDIPVLPGCVVKLIDIGERATVERGTARARVPELSAVKTNAAGRTSWWYSLPIRPRHHATVFVPRVVTRRVHAFMNDPSEAALVDANFSTFAVSTPLGAHTLFALLNSVWVAAALELMGAPLGGGALKVEATHLRRLPVPVLGTAVMTSLERLGMCLAEAHLGQEEPITREIDVVVARALGASEPEALQGRLHALLAELVHRRQRGAA